MTYKEAAEIFATAKWPEKGKPLENNTRLFKRSDDYAVQLHQTDVVTIHKDGTYTLRTDSWQTLTTKDRINKYAPVTVYQHQGIWYLNSSGWNLEESLMFEEGMRVDPKKAPKVLRDQKAWKKRRKLMRKAVTDYINDFVKKYEGVGLPLSEDGKAFSFAGDCWYCLMFMPDEKQAPGDVCLDHLLMHIEQGYYVPSLLRKAICWCNYPDPAAIYSMIHFDLKRGGNTHYLLKNTLEYFFRPLINRMTDETSPAIIVRQKKREQMKRKRKVKA